MKIPFWWLLALAFPLPVSAQLRFDNSNIGRMVDLTDMQGQTLLRKYDPDVKGSPFLSPDWAQATLTLSQGTQISPVKVKMNLESNELYYLDSTGRELAAQPGLVRKIDFMYLFNHDNVRYIFKSGYPAIDKQTENYFYQVLAEGRIELLVRVYKYISVTRDGFTNETTKEFEDGLNQVYVYANGRISPFKPSRSSLLELMADQEKSMADFLRSSGSNLKKTAELAKVFEYYNQLP